MPNNNVLNYFDQPENKDNIFNLDGTWKIGGVIVSATAADLNIQASSGQTETVIAAGALANNKRISNLALVGAGAVTLAAPDASMKGQTKIIEMTVDNGDVTLALTNIQGGTAATTATFSAVGQALILVAGTSKWTVTGQGGVVLS